MSTQKKICPSCGQEFTCTGVEDCWCENAKVHKAEMVYLMQTYTDCICETCLRKFEKD